jgi:hypothetical protein
LLGIESRDVDLNDAVASLLNVDIKFGAPSADVCLLARISMKGITMGRSPPRDVHDVAKFGISSSNTSAELRDFGFSPRPREMHMMESWL